MWAIKIESGAPAVDRMCRCVHVETDKYVHAYIQSSDNLASLRKAKQAQSSTPFHLSKGKKQLPISSLPLRVLAHTCHLIVP